MGKPKGKSTSAKSSSDGVGPPRLTISVLTRDSEDRLERLLAEASWLADQIVVGVDAASTDRTLEIASRLADRVFTFRQAGAMSAARMMIFDYAVGDWILVLDDDESLEPGFADLLPELMSRAGATHYWFPRKWIVNTQPYEFADAPPWYPDWQMRLFRNDRALVWKPARPHSGYQVLGPGYFEPRVSIQHFEPVWCTPQARSAKLARYRAAGAAAETEAQYPARITSPRRPAIGPSLVEPRPRPEGFVAIVDPKQRDGTALREAPWGMQVLEVELPSTASSAAPVVAKVRIRNTGDLAWTPSFGARGARLGLGFHLLDAAQTLIAWDHGGRTAMRDHVAPGGETTFLHVFDAPARPGDYLLRWNMVDEGEAWFPPAETPVLTPLTIVPGQRETDRLFLDLIAERVPGWLSDQAALLTLELLRWQSGRGVRGPVYEIGVYAGRYLAVLAREAVAAGDAVVGLDTFERVDEAAVRANLTEVGLPGDAVRLAPGPSTGHSAESLLAVLGGPARFVSIDGSHLFDDMLHDLMMSDAVLADAGIIACDDFLNPGRLGVGEAIHAHLARTDNLAPFAYVQNKLFLCRKAAQPALLAEALVFCDGATPATSLTQMYGWDVASLP